MTLGRAKTLLTGWFLGVGTCALAGAGVGALILFGGAYDTRASRPHGRLVARAIHQTMLSAVRRRASRTAPRPITAAAVLSGARLYDAHCIACHGGPGVARARWASAMMPTPPYLIDLRNRWSRPELREIVGHGVKMTAMPAWGELLPARSIDDLVDFLWAAPSLTVPQFDAIRRYARTTNVAKAR